MMKRIAAWFRERRAIASETSFERGYWGKVQRADAALLPLSQIGKGTAHVFETGTRPGTLKITVGDETVTLDPTSSHEKYMRDRAKAHELLEIIGGKKP